MHFIFEMIRIRFLCRNVENSQVAKNKMLNDGGEGKKQLLPAPRSCLTTT